MIFGIGGTAIKRIWEESLTFNRVQKRIAITNSLITMKNVPEVKVERADTAGDQSAMMAVESVGVVAVGESSAPACLLRPSC